MSVYYDGELSLADQQKMSQHLNSCYSCRSYFENLKLIQDKIASFKPPEGPDEYSREVAARIVQRLAAEQILKGPARKEKFLWLMKKRWLVALPAFLLIIFAGLLYHQVSKKPDLFNEPYYFFQEPFELIGYKIEINDEASLALNDLIEQEIIDLTLNEIDYHSLVEYLYLSLGDLQDEEKEILLKEIFTTHQENSL